MGHGATGDPRKNGRRSLLSLMARVGNLGFGWGLVGDWSWSIFYFVFVLSFLSHVTISFRSYFSFLVYFWVSYSLLYVIPLDSFFDFFCSNTLFVCLYLEGVSDTQSSDQKSPSL